MSDIMRDIIEIKHAGELDRRSFLKQAGGLLLAFTYQASTNRAEAAGPGTAITNYIHIGIDQSITVFVGGGEMGQGIWSGLAMGVAEDLFVAWESVKIEPITASLSWLTGGSSGVARRMSTFRAAGATTRQLLVNAAAATWGVDPSVCVANNGVVINQQTNATLTYGQLAPLASTLPVPAGVPLVAPEAYRILGTSVTRKDIADKVNGRAKYGLDVMVPGMVFAAIKNCPVAGGTPKTPITAPSGSLGVVVLDTAVAVLAKNSWAAMNMANSLSVSWNYPLNYTKQNSADFAIAANTLLGSTKPYVLGADNTGAVYTAETAGTGAAGLAASAKVLEFNYSFPYLAHCCMEVLNCTAYVTPTSCEIWAPTQAPNSVLKTAQAITGLPASAIKVNVMLMGGGLGRKFEQDYITQAIQVARAVGKPVKLIYSREQDMGRDYYRPMAVSRVRVGLDAANNVTALHMRNVVPSISAQRGVVLGAKGDSAGTEGLVGRTYALPNRLIEYVQHPAPVPVGYWRSVGNSYNAFIMETVIDEIAVATNADPYLLRRKLLANDPRSLAVLDAAAQLGGWNTPVPVGRARGIAIAPSFGSIVAQVVEVSVLTATSIKVHSVACAVDCGFAMNPNSVEAQMQGGIIHGLSAMLWGQVTFKSGVASARNFNNYPPVRMKDAPLITVQILNSGAAPSGTGEPGVPPIGPAVAAAYFRLTGKRVRALPFFPGTTISG